MKTTTNSPLSITKHPNPCSPARHDDLIPHVAQQPHVVPLLAHELAQQVQQEGVEVSTRDDEPPQLALQLTLLAVLLRSQTVCMQRRRWVSACECWAPCQASPTSADMAVR